jgi:hypothetical protein
MALTLISLGLVLLANLVGAVVQGVRGIGRRRAPG